MRPAREGFAHCKEKQRKEEQVALLPGLAAWRVGAGERGPRLPKSACFAGNVIGAGAEPLGSPFRREKVPVKRRLVDSQCQI